MSVTNRDQTTGTRMRGNVTVLERTERRTGPASLSMWAWAWATIALALVLSALPVGAATASTAQEAPGPSRPEAPASIGEPAARTGVSAAALATGADLCAQVGHAAGFRGDSLVVAVAVALAESSCVPSAINPNGPTAGCPSGSRDRGLWQINDCYHPDVTDGCAFDPQCNANAAFSISSGGTDWDPWTTWDNGAYRNHLDEARAAVDRLAPPPPPPPPPSEADGSALVVDAAGDVWFAAVKTDGTLYTRRFDASAGSWNTFTSHGGGWSVHAAPALAWQADGTMRLFAVKANGLLYSQKWVPGVGWSGLSEQGTGGGWATDAGPVAVTRSSGEITFAAVKATGELYTRTYTPGTDSWSDFGQHGGSDWSAHAAPGLVAGTDGRLWLFAVKGSGRMFHRSYTVASGWTGFYEDGAGGWSTYAGPVGTARAGGSITWAAVKSEGSLYTRSYDAGADSWSGFARHGDAGTWSMFASPSVVSTTDGRIWLFAVKQGGVVYHHSYEAGSGWGPFYEDASAWSPRISPVAAARPDGGLTWTSTKDDGVLYTRSYTGTWSGYHAHSTSWAN